MDQPPDDVALPLERIATEEPDKFQLEFRCLKHDNLRIAVLGHSFVYNLERYLPSKPTTFSTLRCFSEKGARLSTDNMFTFYQYQACHEWIQYRPHLTFIIMGGNDIEFTPMVDDIFRHYKTLTQMITWEGTHMAVAIENRHDTRGTITPQYFNYKRDAFNDQLYADSPNRYVPFSSQLAPYSARNFDGIHLSRTSNKLMAETILFHMRWAANIA
jgi:hypothetical protein